MDLNYTVQRFRDLKGNQEFSFGSKQAFRVGMQEKWKRAESRRFSTMESARCGHRGELLPPAVNTEYCSRRRAEHGNMRA